MVARYAPKIKCRAGRAAVTLFKDQIAVSAPIDYGHARWFQDPTTRAGYVHTFLRPFRAVVAGFIPHPGFIVYPFVDAAPIDGLRCPGAISAYQNPRRGFTLVFFPTMQKVRPTESEVDHLTAHIDFDAGAIRIDEMHAKVRLGGLDVPTKNLVLKGEKDEDRPFGFVKHDDNHFAFETWCRSVRDLDPAGSIESRLLWSTKISQARKARLRASIENSIPRTLACSVPAPEGLVSPGAPVLVRVGLLTEKGRELKGGPDAALSQPHGVALGVSGMRLHLYNDIRGIDPSWPEGVSLFVEIGLLKSNPPNDHNLPDVRGSAFQRITGASS